MKPQKRVTIKDIAQHLGISPSTVCRVVTNNLKAQVHPTTRQKVLEAAAELGYYPNLLARAVITRKSGVLGLLTYGISSEDPILASYVKNIITEAHRHGYQVMVEIAASLLIKDPLDDQRLQIRQMISRGVDGLLLHARGDPDEARRIVEAVGDVVPVVSFSQVLEGISCVVLDRAAGINKATEHLIRLGHRRIGFVGGDWDMASVVAKWESYLGTMQAHGLTPERIIIDDSTLETGRRVGIQLGRTSNRPTALICWDDMSAIGVCRGLKETGVQVPEDVAVVGFDGLEIGAYCTPPLTTVAQPVINICQEVIQLLVGQLNGEKMVRHVMMQSHLVVRQSCGAGG